MFSLLNDCRKSNFLFLFLDERYSRWNGRSSPEVNPEELGNYFEGDIIFPNNGILPRNGIIGASSKWPHGIIPYVIDPIFSSADRRILEWAFTQYERLTCIKFVPRIQETDYVHITGDQSGCFSAVGRIGGRQQVNLQIPACVQRGTVIHELMHAVGFFHEHSRMDRDKYITIAYHNILPGREVNFERRVSDSFNVPYDYRSIMHYSENAFSKNGLPTLIAKEPGVTIGQRVHFSKKDLRKIQRMYKCKRSRSFF
ncbi:hypothetical protein O3M35_001624 [Rhynocoris fuscipes]|uniref:Metalloendopeptidase n=1 Tax=Rhynocoris fuscipes TaxID=488301 RepID=A0AAW1CU40_9HEMI